MDANPGSSGDDSVPGDCDSPPSLPVIPPPPATAAPVKVEDDVIKKEDPDTDGPPDGEMEGDTGEDEDQEGLIKLKPPRPPRKKVKETLKDPLYEEDIIEGFSFAAFETYDDLEVGQNLIYILLPRIHKSRNDSPRSAVTQSLGCFSRMSTRLPR